MALRKVNLRQDKTLGKVNIKHMDAESVGGFVPTTEINTSDDSNKFWPIQILKEYVQNEILDKRDIIIGDNAPIDTNQLWIDTSE